MNVCILDQALEVRNHKSKNFCQYLIRGCYVTCAGVSVRRSTILLSVLLVKYKYLTNLFDYVSLSN